MTKRRGIYLNREESIYVLDAIGTLLEEHARDNYSRITPFFSEQLKDLRGRLRRKLYDYNE